MKTKVIKPVVYRHFNILAGEWQPGSLEVFLVEPWQLSTLPASLCTRIGVRGSFLLEHRRTITISLMDFNIAMALYLACCVCIFQTNTKLF
jgi:hypothetical protein